MKKAPHEQENTLEKHLAQTAVLSVYNKIMLDFLTDQYGNESNNSKTKV